jgi:hypothetical protein
MEHIFLLDHGCITVECPRLMSDDELADVLAAFVVPPPLDRERVGHDSGR